MAALIVVFAVSLYMAISIRGEQAQEASAFHELADAVAQIRSTHAPEADGQADEKTRNTLKDVPVLLPEYQELHKSNHDLFGWISIEDTELDYPVMYTPRESEYYLRRAFDGSDSQSGTPFVDGACRVDGSFYLIYGHHMKNGTMFGSLTNYADAAWCESHPVIRFDTIYERREYAVMAAFYADAAESAEGFRYYEYTDLAEQNVFEEYIRHVKDAALYDTGVTAAYGDELIALSTCSYHTSEGRFVVVAKRMTENPTVTADS